MTKEEAKDIFSEYHTGEAIDYDYAIELVVKYCNKKELINEEELDYLAEEYTWDCKERGECDYLNKIVMDAFKEGYCKAKEE